MNEAMKQAWLEITQMLEEPTEKDLDVFLRAWQRAIQAEREACWRLCDALWIEEGKDAHDCREAIRARGQK
jgi:hypothetical protein